MEAVGLNLGYIALLLTGLVSVIVVVLMIVKYVRRIDTPPKGGDSPIDDGSS
jgi:hypothetical protein